MRPDKSKLKIGDKVRHRHGPVGEVLTVTGFLPWMQRWKLIAERADGTMSKDWEHEYELIREKSGVQAV